MDVDAVSSMCPCQPAGSPSSSATQSSTTPSSSVEAGDVRQRIAFWLSVAARSSARMAGSELELAKYAKNRGVLPVRHRRQEDSSTSFSTAENGSPCSGAVAGSRDRT